jgi:hypothetical protein
MKYLYFLLLVFLVVFNTRAADRYSILDGGGNPGTWTSGTYWSAFSGGASCSCTPAMTDRIFIYQTIELNQTISLQANTGRLEIAASKSLYTTTKDLSVPSNTTLVVYGTLEVYNLIFYNGCNVYVAPGAVIIVHNDFTNRNNSDQVVINGAVTVEGTFDNGNGGVVTGTGSITANDYDGAGTTFGHTPTSSIPDGITVTSNPLPVEFMTFNGTNSKTGVVLTWQTLTELNNKEFQVERSINGYLFKTIGMVKGAGTVNTPSFYTFTDKPDVSEIYYYRLRQVDFDGKYAYSPTVAVQYILKGEIKVYPNPVEAGSEINIMGYEDEIFIVEIYNSNLQMVSEHISDGKLILDRNLAPGTYYIITKGDNNSSTSKIVIY